MLARTFTVKGTHGLKEAELLVSYNYDADRVTLCMPTCDYIDIELPTADALRGALTGWVDREDGLPPVGVHVLILTRNGAMHTATRAAEGNVFIGSLGGRMDPANVVKWALPPPLTVIK